MPSFFGLNIAMSGLRAQQFALDTTANNIANAGTEGYHRQEVVFVPGNPLRGMADGSSVGSPQLGTGVMVQSVKRMQSSYVDNQVRMANQWLGNWQYRDDTLKQVESVISEPSDVGLQKTLNAFWNAWEDLGNQTTSSTSKVSLVENAATLANQINELNNSLRDMQSRTDRDIADSVTQVNTLAHEIANCNEQIRKSVAGGYQPNDILDRRDLLLNDLSKIAHVDVTGMSGAESIITIGGRLLVKGDQVNTINTSVGPDSKLQLTWSDDNSPVTIEGGQIAGELETRDNILEGYLQSLHTMSKEIVDSVNELHSTGVLSDGTKAGNFFVPGGYAGNMAVDPSILASPSAAGVATTVKSGEPGNNDLAREIANLKEKTQPNGNTIMTEYSSLVAHIGAQSRESKSRVDLYTSSLGQLENQRDSIAGVSIDDEMLNMVKFQQAYNASARVFQVMDELIDTIITKMGS